MKKSMKRKMERLVKKDELVEQSMVVRLNQYTAEYRALEEEKERYYRKNINNITREIIQSLYLQQYYIDTRIKAICKLVDALNNLQIDFDNEIATQVYNYYAPLLKRGLSPLI